MNRADRFFEFHSSGRAFLGRARDGLARFDSTGDVSALFYSALDLRFGIEARLFEYIRAALGPSNVQRAAIREYTASKLLNRLAVLNPDSPERAVIVLRLEGEPEGAGDAFEYTPVTPRLAEIHGRLGELLHYKYFWKHNTWYIKRRTQAGSITTLLDARDLVAEGIEQLAYSTRGTLLGHPRFTELVEELEREAEVEQSEPEPPAS